MQMGLLGQIKLNSGNFSNYTNTTFLLYAWVAVFHKHTMFEFEQTEACKAILQGILYTAPSSL